MRWGRLTKDLFCVMSLCPSAGHIAVANSVNVHDSTAGRGKMLKRRQSNTSPLYPDLMLQYVGFLSAA